MKTRISTRYFVFAIVMGLISAFDTKGAQFFRISGPATTAITALKPDGTLVWSNSQPGATYTVQTLASLPSGSNWVDYVQLPTTNAVNTNLLVSFNPPAGMKFVPAGLFTMGDSLGEGDGDNAPTNATVSAFFMDANLVSYGQWQSVYNWAISNSYTFIYSGSAPAANQPVQTIWWYDCVLWSNARSQQAGLLPVYYTDTNLTQVYTNFAGTPYVNWSANGYRLPTEAEWEKAARGGLVGQRFPWGDTISWSEANYYADPQSLDPYGFAYDLAAGMGYDPAFTATGTSPAGYFAPNGYGLSDMAGNVWEWCWDWYGTPYAGGQDPRGPSSGSYRVLRGGCYFSSAYFARCAHRNNNPPNSASSNLGFRCVKGL